MTAPTLNARVIVESALYQHVMAERDRYRAALVQLRSDHGSARNQFCECGICECGMFWPCPTRDYLDEILGGAS